MSLFVTEPSVPLDVSTVTVPPPAVRLFPFESASWTVIVDVLEPLATIDAADGVIVDVAVEAAPVMLVNGSLVPCTLPSSAVTVYAVPAVVPVVNVTVAMPLESVVDVVDEKEPSLPVFDHVTLRPEVETGLSFASVS